MIALTDKQERFVAEYLIDQNASAAARRAGYSARSASSVATELMRIPHVRERVEQALRDMLAEIKCTAMALMRERMRAAFFRARKLFKGNELRAFDELDDDTYDALFISYEVRASGPIIRVRQPNREQALRALERVHERLDRLQDARCMHAGSLACDHEIEQEDAAPSASAPAGVVPDLERAGPEPKARPAPPSTQWATPLRSSPNPIDAPQQEAAPYASLIPERAQAVPAPGEKTQVFTGSMPMAVPPEVAKPRFSPFDEVIAAWRARKSSVPPGPAPACAVLP